LYGYRVTNYPITAICSICRDTITFPAGILGYQ
jgi:hypothetical protein